MELIAFRAEHLMSLLCDTSARMALEARVKEYDGIAFSAVENGNLLGCGGLVMLNPYRAHVWACLTPEIKTRHRVWMHRTAKKYFGLLIETLSPEIIEAEVLAESQQNCRWIRKFGFAPKWLREKITPQGDDMWIFELRRSDGQP